jgi:hypothetical protein
MVFLLSCDIFVLIKVFVWFLYDHDAFRNHGPFATFLGFVGKPLPKVVCTIVVL